MRLPLWRWVNIAGCRRACRAVWEMGDCIVRISRVVATLLLAALAGCSTLATRYGPREASVAGGYSETRLNATTYEVRFQGNGYTDVKVVSELLLRRAAELTLEHGYRYFAVTQRQTLTTVEDPAATATIAMLDEFRPDAIDSATVVSDTEAAAGGVLSQRAREQLRRFGL